MDRIDDQIAVLPPFALLRFAGCVQARNLHFLQLLFGGKYSAGLGCYSKKQKYCKEMIASSPATSHPDIRRWILVFLLNVFSSPIYF